MPNSPTVSHSFLIHHCLTDWLIDWVKVLHPTRHKVGHFRYVLQTNQLAWYGKTKPNTTKTHIHQSKEILVACYDIRPGNREGLFWFWCFINLWLTYLLGHLSTYLQPQDPHGHLDQTTITQREDAAPLKMICNGLSQNWSKVVSSCLLQYKPVCVINFDKLRRKMLKSRILVVSLV